LRLLALIDRAISSGAPHPHNDLIGETLGFREPSSASRLVREAIEHGVITADYPDCNTRILALTDLGRRRLAAASGSASSTALAGRPPPRRGPDLALRCGRPVDVRHLAPIDDDGADRAARSAAVRANDRFLAAMAKLVPVPDVIDRDGERFNRLPPPTLTGQSFS
jgi:hypothetical protein